MAPRRPKVVPNDQTTSYFQCAKSSQGTKLWLLLPVSIRRCQRRRFFSLLHNHGRGSPTKIWVVKTKKDIMNTWYHTLCHQSEEMLYYNHIFVPWQPSRGPAWRRGVIFDSRGVPGQDLNCGKYYSNEFEQSRFSWFSYACTLYVVHKHWFNTWYEQGLTLNIHLCKRRRRRRHPCLSPLSWLPMTSGGILIYGCAVQGNALWVKANNGIISNNFWKLSLILWLCGARQVECKRIFKKGKFF